MFNFALSAAPAAPAAADAVKNAEKSVDLAEALTTGGLGYAVVFFGIVLLMVIIMIFGKVMGKKKAAEASPAAPAPAACETAPAAPAAAAPVKAECDPNAGLKDGKRICDLHSVDDKTAAMLMAIVADKTQIPVNELRFISIKEM